MNPIIEKNFGTPAALRAAVEALLRESFAGAAGEALPFAVMLSGGSTPLPVYQTIAAEPSPCSPLLTVTFSDDRHVPLDSPQSNHGNTLPMLAALKIPTDRVIAVNPEVPLDEAAAQYERDFDAFFARDGVLRLALLGVGEDTHTCSLFSDADLAASEGRLAIPVRKDTPPDRVSVTPSVLELADRVVFLVSGPGKLPVIRQLLKAPESTIAGRAVAGCPSVELWHDQ